jgi:hypothetical protein
MSDPPPAATGGCLCGAVRYRVEGSLRDIFVCHCSVCRRTHGGPAAYAACGQADLILVEQHGLRWHEHEGARRGFCAACGSRLFWARPQRPTISIAAGTLDEPTGLRVERHIFVADAADWEAAPHDNPGSRT